MIIAGVWTGVGFS